MPGAVCVSGYTSNVAWLESMLLDVAFIARVYVPWRRHFRDKLRAHEGASFFMQHYETLIRSLGFSALSDLAGTRRLMPTRLTQ